MADNMKINDKTGPVWPCSRETAAAIPVSDLQQATRKRATIQFAAAFAIVLVIHFFFKKPVMATVVAGIATFVLACGLLLPKAFLAIEKFAFRLGEWLAIGLTWILLVPFFYICFIPGRIIMALAGKDPLNLKFSSTATSYWVPRAPVGDISRYQKQH